MKHNTLIASEVTGRVSSGGDAKRVETSTSSMTALASSQGASVVSANPGDIAGFTGTQLLWLSASSIALSLVVLLCIGAYTYKKRKKYGLVI